MNAYQVAVIGAGPGGYVAAIRAAQLGLKTVCIEKRKHLGGTCLNVGCIPSKSLLYSSELFSFAKDQFSQHGIEVSDLSINFSKIMKRKEEVVQKFTEGISYLLKKNQIDTIYAEAKLIDPHTIQVGEKQITADSIIIATGSEPTALQDLPFDETKIISSTKALNLQTIPEKLLIVGAGIIGIELGSVYNRLGSKVQFVEFLDHICPSFDLDVSKLALKLFTSQGMEFYLSHQVTGAKIGSDGVSVFAKSLEGVKQFQADVVLVCVGRKPYSENLGLKELKIAKDEKGFILVNEHFQTSVANIYAIGDVINGPMLAHKASDEGIAVSEIIASNLAKVEYMAIPSVAYTFPEIASVGLSEEEVEKKKIPYQSSTFPLKANSRARCTAHEEGFVKVIAHKTSHHILGVHIVSDHASELIAEGALAIHNRLKVEELFHTSHAHPTLSESLKEAALGVFGKPLHL